MSSKRQRVSRGRTVKVEKTRKRAFQTTYLPLWVVTWAVIVAPSRFQIPRNPKLSGEFNRLPGVTMHAKSKAKNFYGLSSVLAIGHFRKHLAAIYLTST